MAAFAKLGKTGPVRQRLAARRSMVAYDLY
jgi:hypothetical protein